jgi:hypothetical protein
MWTLKRLWHILGDGQWHTVKEVSESLNTSPDLVVLFMLFLGKHSLVEFDKLHENIRISEDVPLLGSAIAL